MLERLSSVINDSVNAQDKDRAFTFIEFVKLFGYDKTDTVFLGDYKEYLTRWAAKFNQDSVQTDEEFVREKLFEILKSITLTYSSYEEQQYISSIDWKDEDQIKQVIPLYVRKIREICEFYRTKRNEAFLIVEKNKRKGSAKSIQQIVYDKIFDFIFDNKNLKPQMSELAQDLHVSVEQFVDTFSEYYDIPRDEDFRLNEDREEMITANMNDVDYRNYIEINTVINEIIYSGEVYLEGLPLIANLGLDFSQECVGDMLALKNTLVANATIDLVPINEKISLRRKLYEKFVGCDLYYLYCDDAMNVTMDLLVKAKNPTGNLLNCGNPDTAVIPSNQLELLTHVGLFFKPDKNSILKVNARNYTWEIDASRLLEDTVYVFPDPNRYGDIGNNKTQGYPLVMEFKLDHDIRNLSSGIASNDPLALLDEQVWSSYYSRQQDLFKVIDNKDFAYSFTSLANSGFCTNYQTDPFGNEFGLFKGYNEVWVRNEEGEWVLDHIEVPSNNYPEFNYPTEQDDKTKGKHYIINGGYFEDPFAPGEWVINEDGERVYIPGKPFDHQRELKINDYYEWTGMRLGIAPIVTPSLLYDGLIFGEFGGANHIKYIDHFMYTERQIDRVEDKEDVVTDVDDNFESNVAEDDVPVVKVDKSFVDIQAEAGEFYIKNNASLENRPQKFSDVFYWLPEDVRSAKWVSFSLMKQVLIVENDDEIIFVPYRFDGTSFLSNLGINPLLRLSKEGFFVSSPLWNEKERVFYIAFLEPYSSSRSTFVLTVYKFDPAVYKLSEVYCGWNFIPELKEQFDALRKRFALDQIFFTEKRALIKDFVASEDNASSIDSVLFSGENNLENFEFSYEEDVNPGKIVFSYNSALNLYLLAYIVNNNNGIPSIFEHKFKLVDEQAVDRTLRSSVYSFLAEQDGSFALFNEFPASGKASPEDSFFFVPN